MAGGYVNLGLDKRGLTFFDARDAAARHKAVAQTLGLSIALLNPTEQRRFEELAVFAEDVDIPLGTLAAYWGRSGGLDDFDTEALCERLFRLSLVLDFDPTARFIRMLDVVRQFLLGLLGVRVAGLHAGLLDSLRGGPDAGAGWAHLPDGNSCAWAWLFHHLEGAGQRAQMVATALDLRYLARKTLLRSTFAVEADLAAAMSMAQQAQQAQQAQPPDGAIDPASRPNLHALRKGYAQSAHLLARCAAPREVLNTLLTRLQHVPALQAMLPIWQQDLGAPSLQAAQPLPDLAHPALLRTLSGHRGSLLACAFSADGAQVVTAGHDRVIKVWDARSGVESNRLVGHGGWVTGLAASADGRLLASASTERRLRLWDMRSGEALAVLAGRTDGLTRCAFAPDGSVVVSASFDSTLKVWRVADGALLHTLARTWTEEPSGRFVSGKGQGHWSAVHGCAISPDGLLLASASSDQTLILWALDSGQALHLLLGHSAGVTDCCFSPDGAWLASASSDRSARIWNVATGEQHQVLEGHSSGVTALAFSADGRALWCVLADSSVVAWDLAAGALTQVLSGHTGTVNHCAVSCDGLLLASASADGTVRLWEADESAGAHTPRQPVCAPRQAA